MAKSGVLTNTFATGRYIMITWEIVSQDYKNNNSTLLFTAYLVSQGSGYYISSSATKTVTITAGKSGEIPTEYTYTAKGLLNLAEGETKELFSKELTFHHDPDGSLRVIFGMDMTIEATLGGTYVSTASTGLTTSSVDAPAGPTTPQINQAVNVGKSVRIYLPADNSDFHHILYWESSNNVWQQFAYNVNSYYDWTVDLALSTKIPNATSGKVRIRCDTYADNIRWTDEVIGEKIIEVSFYITEDVGKPAVTFSVSQTNNAGVDAFIPDKSTVKLTATAEPKLNATLVRYEFSYCGETKTITTANKSATVSFLLPEDTGTTFDVGVTVTDTRGFSTTAQQTLDTLPYGAPMITTLTATRGEYDGTTFRETLAGKMLKIVLAGEVEKITETTAIKYKIEYRAQSETEYTVLIDETDIAADDINLTLYTDEIFDENTAYTIRATLMDTYVALSRIIVVRSRQVMLNFSPDGTSMCIGGMATHKDQVEILMKMRLTSGFVAIPLPAGADLREYVQAGWYAGNCEGSDYKNCPVAEGSFLLEVIPCGTGGELMQRLTRCDRISPTVHQCFYEDTSWGDWIQVVAAGSYDVGGAIFIPSISSDGYVSWTNNAGLPNPNPVCVMGTKPVRGTDYWTEADQQRIVEDVIEALPAAEGVSY